MTSYKEIVEEGDIWNVWYVIDAPWAHPLWSQYVIIGYTLDDKSTRYRGDVTHEVMVYAVDPGKPMLHSSIKAQKLATLSPANFGYQLTTTNEALVTLLDDVVDRIDHLTMSPDTDFRWQWDSTFITKNNAVTLHSSIFEQAPAVKH